MTTNKWVLLALCASLSLLLRCAVAFHPYSGQGKPPLFGDYEAQRHWMEITTNLPLKQWYWNTTDNNLLYWGLDYPPLTAYHAWICGKVAQIITPELVLLHESRGIETEATKFFMRMTVIVADALVLLPAVFLVVFKLYAHFQNLLLHNNQDSVNNNNSNSSTEIIPFSYKVAMALFILLQPALILIDSGHFQYNGISLAFATWAVCFLLCDRIYWGSVFFVLSLNYKQMSLYYSLAFFFYLLGVVWGQSRQKHGCYSLAAIAGALVGVAKLGAVVIVTFLICWSPFVFNFGPFTSPAIEGTAADARSSLSGVLDIEGALQVLRRLFPFSRGLYEDKVANFWCSISPFIKVHRLLPSSQAVIRLCGITTLLGCLPSGLDLLLRRTNNNSSAKIRLVFAMTNCALSFFLFSFQVHEKSVLLPLMPATLLIGVCPVVVPWFVIVAMFSMYPLVIKDDLRVAYFALLSLFSLFAFSFARFPAPSTSVRRLLLKLAMAGSFSGMAVISLLMEFVAPPARYPDIFTYFCVMFSCAHFLCFWIYFHIEQFKWAKQPSTKTNNHTGITRQKKIQ